jgi:uncharacterized protein YegL
METYIIMILDRSFSMEGKETDVIGGFNHFLKEQKKLKDNAKLMTVLFDDQYEILHDGLDIQKVKPITSKDYFVRGNTALLDAVGRTIENIDSYATDEDKVLFFINTDGRENSSHKFNKAKIKEMVEHLQNEHNWRFVFLGAGIDAFAAGSTMGIRNSFNTSNTVDGISANYVAVSSVTSTFRATKGETLDIKKLKDLDKVDSNTGK